VDLEVESPFPQRVVDAADAVQVQASGHVAVDLDEIVGKVADHRLILRKVRAEDLAVVLQRNGRSPFTHAGQPMRELQFAVAPDRSGGRHTGRVLQA